MGTRAVTNVVDLQGDTIVSLYRQFDGYPMGGHGEELADFLDGAAIGNGISGNPPVTFFNGMGDLALRLVTFFRQDHRQMGGFYLIPAGTDWGPDYTYTIHEVAGVPAADAGPYDRPEGTVRVSVNRYSGAEIFSGTVEEFKTWMKLEDEDDE